jgi:hypothetical protein
MIVARTVWRTNWRAYSVPSKALIPFTSELVKEA